MSRSASQQASAARRATLRRVLRYLRHYLPLLILSLLLAVYSLVQYFTGHAVEGYTTIIIVLLLIGSAVMISLGIIGYYIAKIYEEVKRRPRYIISRIVRGGDSSNG